MSDQEEEILSRTGLIIIGIISALIFVIGIILLALGYNEAFYVDNAVVQTIFKIITFMGDPVFFIILLAFIFIVYDKRFAKNVAFSLLLSVYLFAFIKDVIQDPRPSTNIDPREEYGYLETDYGFPSGHAVNAVAVWGYMAHKFKDKTKPYIIPGILSAIIFLIAISRIIIGMHDLQDIIGGLLIGIGFIIAFIYLEPVFSEKINSLNLSIKIIIVVVVCISLFLLGTLLFPTSGLNLVENAPKYSDAGYYSVATGAILEFSVGYLLENKYIDYQPSELNAKQKIINLIIGLLIVLTLFFILELLLHGNVVLRFIRYCILAFAITTLLPLIFTKINRK